MTNRPSAAKITALAKRLRSAMDSGKGCKPLRQDLPTGDIDAAYAVQEANTRSVFLPNTTGRQPCQ